VAQTVPLRTWIAVTGGTLGAFMAVLNIQVVNAALGDIQGALAASADDVGWISTAYLVAEIVVIPLTGWLSRVFSVRRYLIANAALFVVFSVACAFAQDFGQLIALRALQGLAGGVLIPMAFTLIITLLPPSQQPVGLSIFALAATIAPSFGPTLGGWLSAAWGWQTIFYITVAPGVAMIAMLWASLERQPMQLQLLRRGDWLGILTMVLGLGSLQVALEEGEREDWFDSAFILCLSAIAAVSLCLFVWAELRTTQPLINLRLLTRRNFFAGTTASFLVGFTLAATLFIQPIYLGRVQGYNSQQIGQVLVWAALPQFVVIPLLPILMKRVDPRGLVALGFALFATANVMNIGITGDFAADQLLLPNVLGAVGFALILTPLNLLALDRIGSADAPSASALLAILFNLGAAIGIAAMQTFLGRREQLHMSQLSEGVSLLGEETRGQLDRLARYFMEHGVRDPGLAWRKAVATVAQRAQEQAAVMAFSDAFYALTVAMLLALAMVAICRRPAAKAAEAR
jgi:DHA2 family multidrug resistance protein